MPVLYRVKNQAIRCAKLRASRTEIARDRDRRLTAVPPVGPNQYAGCVDIGSAEDIKALLRWGNHIL